MGADLRIVEVPVREITLTLNIWDTSGDPKMVGMGRQIYKESDCLVLVYDISSRSSFEALETYWDNYLQYAQPYEPDDFPVILVGNKSDLSDRRAVPLEEVMEWCAFKRPRKPITYIGKLGGIGWDRMG
jgi:Ras-related protein Rab-7A